MSLSTFYVSPIISPRSLSKPSIKPNNWEEYEFFKVFVRLRNFSNIDKGSIIIRKVNNSMLRVYNGKEPKEFSFDYIFDEYDATKYIFTTALQPSLESLFLGYNSTIMAYGMTGSGKTHTMLGEINNISIIDQNPGLIFLAVKDIFWKIHLELALDQNWEFFIKMSYMEIYNEQIRDLLSENPINLQILEDPTKGSIVHGLKENSIKTPQEMIEFINIGNEKRVVAETYSNKFSSRSHAILILNLQKKHLIKNPTKVTHAKLVMVDLAGSERACISENKGARMREGANINRSLLALGNCIKMLSQHANKINYRDSKLTRLLKESLGGNTKTMMIACLSPLAMHYEESMNTLKYANRMRQIKVKMSKNFKEDVLEMELAIKLDEEHRIMSLKSFSNNLMLNLEEIIDMNKNIASLKIKNQENELFLEKNNFSSEKSKEINTMTIDNNLIIHNLELKFQEKCKEKEDLFMKLIDQLGINAASNDRAKDLHILKLNKEIEKLKKELKEKNQMLNTNELPINASSERRKQENILKEPKNFHKRKKNRTPSFIPKTISEIRKYYKTKGESKFRLDFIKSPDLKKQIKPNYLSNQKEKKNIPSLIINRLSTEKKCPQNITKYKDFQAIYKESHSLLTSKRRLPISNMSSIHNDQTSLDSFILDKDIDEHDYHSIEIKNFIKRDSKLKGKHDMLSPPIKSLNTTTQINLTGRLFNEGYYSEEIENSKGKSKIYQSVKDLIKKQQEHLQNEYKKLKDGSNSKRLLEAKHPYSNTLTNLLIEDKLNHS